MVISLDASAHEKSTEKTTNLLEYIDTIKELDKKLDPFEAAIGHSFGSIAIMIMQFDLVIFKINNNYGTQR